MAYFIYPKNKNEKLSNIYLYKLTNMKNTHKNIITDNDLFHTHYPIEELEKNINHLNHKILLKTQHLTASFCAKHILNLNIDGGDEDTYLFDADYIVERQPHLTCEEILKKNKT